MYVCCDPITGYANLSNAMIDDLSCLAPFDYFFVFTSSLRRNENPKTCAVVLSEQIFKFIQFYMGL